MYFESREPVRSADAQEGNKHVVGGHGATCKARQLFLMSSGSSRDIGDGNHFLKLRAISCNAAPAASRFVIWAWATSRAGSCARHITRSKPLAKAKW